MSEEQQNIQPGNNRSQELILNEASLLDHAKICWQFGDWDSILKITRQQIETHSERARLALLVASAAAQSGQQEQARQFAGLALEWGCSRKLVARFLLSGAMNSLGRVRILSGRHLEAQQSFEQALGLVLPAVSSRHLLEGRVKEEYKKLGYSPKGSPTLLREILPMLAGQEGPFQKPERGIKTYAQNFEDVMLWRALGRVEKGFYIDIGAQLPRHDSVSRAFYEQGWRGIHVEPVAQYAELLRQDRPDELVIEKVISDNNQELTLYEVEQTGLSTLSRELAEQHRTEGFTIHERTIQAMTLADLFEQAGGRTIHWLKVDVEGAEEPVLTGWGGHNARPWIVVVEATSPNSQKPLWREWEHELITRGYAPVYYDGLNQFYLHETRQNLLQAFSTPPNVFDNYYR